MSDQIYFEGDPATDSARRHLQRVLQEAPRRRPWLVALVAGGAAWGIWRVFGSIRAARSASQAGDVPASDHGPASPSSAPDGARDRRG